MKEEYIKYETALLAKEQGFSLPISSENYYFNAVGNIHPHKWFHPSEFDVYLDAVTQSVLQKWLREEKNIHIQINYIDDILGYNGVVTTMKDNIEIFETTAHTSYEEVLDEALYSTLNYISVK